MSKLMVKVLALGLGGAGGGREDEEAVDAVVDSVAASAFEAAAAADDDGGEVEPSRGLPCHLISIYFDSFEALVWCLDHVESPPQGHLHLGPSRPACARAGPRHTLPLRLETSAQDSIVSEYKTNGITMG
jgi:hypothetical protein